MDDHVDSFEPGRFVLKLEAEAALTIRYRLGVRVTTNFLGLR